MNWLSSLKNQTVLLALVGLGVLNGLLCAVMILRENANATQIGRLEGEAKTATQAEQTKLADLKTNLEATNSEIARLRSDLTSTSQDLTKARNQIKNTAAELDITSRSLKSAVAELHALAQTVSHFRTNNPWLADTKMRPPWDVQIEKLLNEKKK